MTPKVSILIPVYNAEKFLPRSLNSVFQQTLRDIEIIAVDDASKDNSLKILKEAAEKDSRLKIVVHSENRGTLVTRIDAANAASGDYVMSLDPDDTLDENAAEFLYTEAERKNADIIGFGARFISEYGNTQDHWQTLITPAHMKVGEAIFQECFVEHSYSWSLCFKLIRRSLFQKTIPYLPSEYCVVAEDFLIYTIIASFANRFVETGRIFYNYYTDNGVSDQKQLTFSQFKRFTTLFTALNSVKSFLIAQGKFDLYQNAYDIRFKEHLQLVFERWPWKILKSDRNACFKLLLEFVPTGMLYDEMNSFFKPFPEVLFSALSQDAFIPKDSCIKEEALTVPDLQWHLLEAKLRGEPFYLKESSIFSYPLREEQIWLYNSLYKLADNTSRPFYQSACQSFDSSRSKELENPLMEAEIQVTVFERHQWLLLEEAFRQIRIRMPNIRLNVSCAVPTDRLRFKRFLQKKDFTKSLSIPGKKYSRQICWILTGSWPTDRRPNIPSIGFEQWNPPFWFEMAHGTIPIQGGNLLELIDYTILFLGDAVFAKEIADGILKTEGRPLPKIDLPCSICLPEVPRGPGGMERLKLYCLIVIHLSRFHGQHIFRKLIPRNSVIRLFLKKMQGRVKRWKAIFN